MKRTASYIVVVVLLLTETCSAQRIFDDPSAKQSPQVVSSKPVANPPLNHQLATAPSVPDAHPDSTTGAGNQPKFPFPDATALKVAAALVNDTYKDDIAAATTPDQKKALVQKLLNAAKDEQGANRFELLSTAKDLAIKAGDVEACNAILDVIEASFDVGSRNLRLETYTAVARNVRSHADEMKWYDGISTDLRAAVAADRFAVAKAMADVGLRIARASGDPELVKQATADVQAVTTTASAYVNIKKDLALLADQPTDPDANLKVGTYRCFFKGDWQNGLPMLALGTDPTLKALAGQEVAGVTGAEEQVKLADGWWEIGEKANGTSKQHIFYHAGTFYQQVLPQLSGLARAKVENRLKRVIVPPGEGPRVVNLLRLFDLARDAPSGGWSISNGALVSGEADRFRLTWAYHPPPEYDYKITFTRISGIDSVDLDFKKNGEELNWSMGTEHNTQAWFHRGDQVPFHLDTGRIYTAVIKVRNDGVDAYVDDKLIKSWKRSFNSGNASDAASDSLGVTTLVAAIVLHSAEVVEVTGHGTPLN